MNKIKLLYFLIILTSSCIENSQKMNDKSIYNGQNHNKKDYVSDTFKLPFIGVRYFETRSGISGTGTPHTRIEIKNDGSVIFAFIQINQADKTTTEGSYHAGKFKKYIKCSFEIWDDETRFYEVKSSRIYEVDKNGDRLKLLECCSHLDETACACEGSLSLNPY